MKTVTLTTDGAADPNPGRGSWVLIAHCPLPSQPMEQSGAVPSPVTGNAKHMTDPDCELDHKNQGFFSSAIPKPPMSPRSIRRWEEQSAQVRCKVHLAIRSNRRRSAAREAWLDAMARDELRNPLVNQQRGEHQWLALECHPLADLQLRCDRSW